ncbi:unnamed protein product [Linum trigynum]|uniref:Uncharacterized protein n=1 Tax=Linum trigynum TaxID=586398 RepID=A0AAV2DQ83_9ROSI
MLSVNGKMVKVGEAVDFDALADVEASTNMESLEPQYSVREEGCCEDDVGSMVPETQPFSPSRMEVVPYNDDLRELPSPSCGLHESNQEWDLDAFPFNKESLIETCISVGKILDLSHKDGNEELERQISNSAEELHQRKIRSSRSKLEMEIFRLGPQRATPSGPRKVKQVRRGYRSDH